MNLGRTPTVAVIGAGPGGIAMGVRLAEDGYDFTIFDGAGGLRRDMAQQHLSGCGVRRAFALLLVLVRAESAVEQDLRQPAGDPGLSGAGGAPSTGWTTTWCPNTGVTARCAGRTPTSGGP